MPTENRSKDEVIKQGLAQKLLQLATKQSRNGSQDNSTDDPTSLINDNPENIRVILEEWEKAGVIEIKPKYPVHNERMTEGG